ILRYRSTLTGCRRPARKMPRAGAATESGEVQSAMPDGMQTQTGLMIKTARDVNGVADALTSMLNNLMNELAPLQSAWVGQGGLSFRGVRERMDNDIARLNAALRSIAEAVATAGRDYSVSDEEMRSEMSHAGATAGQITSALKMN